MVDNSFQSIIDELQRIHDEYPDLRFGIVMQNSTDEKKRANNSNLNNMSSKLILTSLKNFNSNTKRRRDKTTKEDKNDIEKIH